MLLDRVNVPPATVMSPSSDILPLIVNPLNVGLAVVFMSCDVLMLPLVICKLVRLIAADNVLLEYVKPLPINKLCITPLPLVEMIELVCVKIVTSPENEPAAAVSY